MNEIKYINFEANKRLFDGLETNFLDKIFEIYVPGFGTVNFKAEEFNTYQGVGLEELKKSLDEQSFKYLLETGGFRERTPFGLGYYKTEKHLQLECFIKDGYLFVFTFGEKQPSRWILALEGIWRINLKASKSHEK